MERERVPRGVRVAFTRGDPVADTLPAALEGDTALLLVEVGWSRGVLEGNCEALPPTVAVPRGDRVDVKVPPGTEGVPDPVGVLPADGLPPKGVDVGDG